MIAKNQRKSKGMVKNMEYIQEPSKNIPVCADVDICVIGGSCTGVFAAVRAARLGATVAIVEKQNCFGGVSASGLVNVWHSLYDIDHKEQIIAGLTSEVLERLKLQDAVYTEASSKGGANFINTEELKIELDNLIKENRIIPFLHTFYSSVSVDKDTVLAVFIQNKDGRSAIKAKFVIDATGDGDIAKDLNLKSYTLSRVQPPSYCFYLQGHITKSELADIVSSHGNEVGLEDDWGWSSKIVNSELTMHAHNHIFNVMCNRASDLTFSEMEGRRKIRALLTLLKKYGDKEQKFTLISSCSQIGIRETVHFETNFRATETELLCGARYDDAVLNGTYRVDIHHSDDNGITFKDLTGETRIIYGKGSRVIRGNWRKEMGLDGEYAKFYQLPFSSIVNNKYRNFIAVGRMLHADEGAFGALRVMVNLNQLGEAAGVAAYCSLQKGISLQEISGKTVRELLRKGGSAL